MPLNGQGCAQIKLYLQKQAEGQIWQIKIEDIQLNLNMNFRFKIISLNVLMQDLGHNDGKNLFALYLKFKVN